MNIAIKVESTETATTRAITETTSAHKTSTTSVQTKATRIYKRKKYILTKNQKKITEYFFPIFSID